jgi:ABC-type antimicrobial peptide transport system permease subunit
MPLISAMNRFKYGTTLLNLILNLILLGIFGLSLILIHSLLLITTETNSFEFGVLRLVGNSKKNVILIILFQCILFSIPAFILALLFSLLVLNRINEIIKDELNTDLNISINLTSFLIAFSLNFLAPVIAAIFPIRNILKKNIATSINTMLNKTQGIKIEVISLQKKELTSMIIFGLITFIYGASIYYFLPLSLISMNFGMIGGIFLWILFGILLGFALLSRNIENFLQKILTYTFLFFTRSYTKLLILKNLAAHRIKNKKTSLMFSLSVGIFIMTSVGFDLILQSTKNMIILQNGSEIIVYSDYGYFTPEEMAPSIMELYKRKLIDSFSLYTVYLDDICLDSKFYITNYGKTVKSRHNLLAINSGYFSATSETDLKISNQNSKYKSYSPSEQLYFSDFNGKVGISGILNYEFNANLNTTMFLKLLNENQEMLFLSKPAFILDSAGGLSMNSQPSMPITREAVISFPLYLDMLQKCRNYFAETYEDISIASYENLPLWGINIKPKESADEKDIDEINAVLRQYGPDADLWLFASMKKRLDTAANIVFFIFYVVSSIVLIFCLFNLTASMTINIFEQKKEIAILRSLGTKKRHVIFIYIAESFILILSSSIIGSIIGGIISYTMALQWAIFTNVNVAFNIPTGGIILIICFSIFGGILSTYFPAKNMLNNSISQLIKSS